MILVLPGAPNRAATTSTRMAAQSLPSPVNAAASWAILSAQLGRLPPQLRREAGDRRRVLIAPAPGPEAAVAAARRRNCGAHAPGCHARKRAVGVGIPRHGQLG